MKKLLIVAAVATGVMSIESAIAQKVIKDASGNVFLDVQDMPTGTFSTTSLNTIREEGHAGNSVYKRLQIAKSDLPSIMTWAEACGISTSYNSSSAIGRAQGQVNTGCKTYSEEGNAGSWRVPTQRELQLMWVMKDALIAAGGSLFASGNYWSSTENTSNNGWLVIFNSGTAGTNGKSIINYVRCVREVAN